jgi:hypothetical protein
VIKVQLRIECDVQGCSEVIDTFAPLGAYDGLPRMLPTDASLKGWRFPGMAECVVNGWPARAALALCPHHAKVYDDTPIKSQGRS